jgi:hypothetical protein
MAGDPVALAAEAYITRVLEVLRERCPGQDDQPLELGFPRWEEDQGSDVISRVGRARYFQLTPDIWTPELVCASRELVDISNGLTEYADLVAALEADPIIGGRLGTEIVGGAGLGGGPWQVLGVVQELVLKIIRQSGGFEVSPESRADLVQRWLRYLRRQHEIVTVLAPLSDFSSESKPIPLSERMVIDELSAEEIGAALTLGGWTVTFYEPTWGMGLATPSMMVPPTFAVRIRYEIPITVGGGTAEEIEATLTAEGDATERVEDVLLALRLFKRGRVGIRSIFKLIPDMWGEASRALSGGRAGYTGHFRTDTFALSTDESSEFPDFYKRVTEARANGVIEAAARRFVYASDRSRPDDELVDLVIAAESLFLAKNERSELSFRLATRGASFADDRPEQRRRVMAFLRKAYDARSDVVHNGTFNEAKLRNLAGDKASAGEFADDLEGIVRFALNKAILLVASRETFPPDWDELLFPATTT